MYKRWIIVLILITIHTTTYAQMTEHTLIHDDITRSYRLFVPEGYGANQTGHLMIVLHGGGMTSQTMINHTGRRFNKLIEEQTINALVVYPDGIGRGWNDGRIRESLMAYRENIDDVDFLLTLADALATEYNINPNQLFVTGFSNGASMSYRLACEQSDRITAIAPVANLIASTIDCEPETPVAVFSILGDEDPIVKLSGGDLIYYDGTPLGNVLSLDETLAIWQTLSSCTSQDTPIPFSENDPDDGTTISITHSLGCEQPVSSMIIHGGGHTWAGSPLYLPIEENGVTSKEIDAGEAIFEFFIRVGLGELSATE